MEETFFRLFSETCTETRIKQNTDCIGNKSELLTDFILSLKVQYLTT